MTDHMSVITYHPVAGWSDPEIKPYGPLSLDPTSSCFHYSTNLFEGMKAYLGPDGKPRLFRLDMNMARMHRSRARVSLNSSCLSNRAEYLVCCMPVIVSCNKNISLLYIRPM